jgi:single-strand DNA-binding protein
MFMNRATLIGYVARNAETRSTSNGLNFTVLTLATKASWKDRDGAWQSHSEFHRCIVWGKFAEFAATLTKGMHLQVEGELRSREYERDGVKQRIWEIRTESILKLDRAERRQEPEPDEANEATPPDVPFDGHGPGDHSSSE